MTGFGGSHSPTNIHTGNGVKAFANPSQAKNFAAPKGAAVTHEQRSGPIPHMSMHPGGKGGM